MSSSIDGANEVIGLEMVFDVTGRVKKILSNVVNNDDEKGVLIKPDPKQNYKSIVSDFDRGAVRVVNEIIFNGDILPPEYDGPTNDVWKKMTELEKAGVRAKTQEVENAKKEMSEIYFRKIGVANFSVYNSQALSSLVVSGILDSVLGNNAGVYKANFSNGKVCHFWKEDISGEVHLCMLMVDDGCNITLNGNPKDKRYIPGAVAIEIKVPVSVIIDGKPITADHITRAWATSKEMYDLLNVNSHEKRKDLILKASSEPILNFGPRIICPSFREELSKAHLIEVFTDEDDDDDFEEKSLAYHSSGDASPVISDKGSEPVSEPSLFNSCANFFLKAKEKQISDFKSFLPMGIKQKN